MKRGIRREKGNNGSRHFDFNEKLNIFNRRQKKLTIHCFIEKTINGKS